VKIAIIGAGTMGSLLAERLAAPGRELLLVDRNPLKAYQIAQQAGCSAGTLEMTAGVDVVILALPAAAVLFGKLNVKPGGGRVAFCPEGDGVVMAGHRAFGVYKVPAREVFNKYF